MCTKKPTYQVLMVGCDNAGKSTLLEQVKKMEGLRAAKDITKIPPTVGLNMATIVKSHGEFVFWDVGGQKLLRKIWNKYFRECHGVVFIVDGSDDSRFDEVREVIDEFYTRRGLDEAGLPIIEKITKSKKQSPKQGNEDDLEAAHEEEKSIEEILKELPCLFLLNKNDRQEFKGIDYIEQRLGLKEINCIESVSLPMSALDLNGVDAALQWIYRAVAENAQL